MDISASEITSKKYVKTMWIFRPSILHQKKYVETTWIFWSSTLHHKKYVQTTWIFRHRNYINKSTWKQRGLFDHQYYIKKSTWKQRGFFDHRNHVEKTTWIFQSIKLHWKIMRKWRGNSSKFGLQRIDVISASNRGWLSVGCPLGSVHKSNHLKLW